VALVAEHTSFAFVPSRAGREHSLSLCTSPIAGASEKSLGNEVMFRRTTPALDCWTSVCIAYALKLTSESTAVSTAESLPIVRINGLPFRGTILGERHVPAAILLCQRKEALTLVSNRRKRYRVNSFKYFEINIDQSSSR